MKIHTLHRWDMTPKEAIALQQSLAAQVIVDRPLDVNGVTTVAGVDVSVKNNVSRAAVVVVTLPDLRIIETVTAIMPTPFPYVPGLLSFREGPVLVEAFAQLNHCPDVFIFDGMGRIHPRRMGIATHMGLWLQTPTIGCGKSHFIGEYDAPGEQKGDYSPLTHKGEQLGVVLRTRTRVKPVYISAGHLIDLDSAITLTLMCTPKYRLPEPVRAAHNAAGL
jgi:deoxyribonuclease V